MQKDKEKVSLEQIQLMEQTIQNLSLQKQVFHLELLETNNAMQELEKLEGDEVYRIVGAVMFKADKEELKKELKKKIELLELRIKSIEKQEQELREKLLKERSSMLKSKLEKK
ncbi:MAG: prefoldin subunit beta [Candidatus Pacearchaeota archaeon]|nr:prefoldin subunit beta [Candidatus Pacearchaeota archaeon]